MANQKQYRPRTTFVAARGVKEYRATIAEWVCPDDVVLEIGCEWGATTALIAPHCKEVIGTDVSSEVIERARQRHPHIRFEVLDGFDVRAALALADRFDKIYIDMSGLSGYRSLLDTIALLNAYATVLRPAAIVIKSGALKDFTARCVAWGPGEQASRGS